MAELLIQICPVRITSVKHQCLTGNWLLQVADSSDTLPLDSAKNHIITFAVLRDHLQALVVPCRQVAFKVEQHAAEAPFFVHIALKGFHIALLLGIRHDRQSKLRPN